MPRKLPRHVSEFADRHGKLRLRFRRTGQAAYYFKARFGTDDFWAEYASCLKGEAAPRVAEASTGKVTHGSVDDLIARFYRSPNWLGMEKESSRTTYRGIVERFRERTLPGGQRIGAVAVTAFRVEHLDAILGGMRDTPAAANNLRKVLRRLFAYAVKIGMRADNPALLTDSFRTRAGGFHTWTEDEIAAFQKRHAVGTRARLALELMLWTGQRRSDIVGLGRQHVEDGRLRLRQVKTGTPQLIMIAPQLRAAIDAMPAGNLTFLVTEFGRPFSPAGFGNWFRERCDEAGLPQCSAHGLRKAMSRRLAELGASHSEGKAVTGHRTDREFSRYAADADQRRLADAAISRLARAELANLTDRLAKSSDN